MAGICKGKWVHLTALSLDSPTSSDKDWKHFVPPWWWLRWWLPSPLFINGTLIVLIFIYYKCLNSFQNAFIGNIWKLFWPAEVLLSTQTLCACWDNWWEQKVAHPPTSGKKVSGRARTPGTESRQHQVLDNPVHSSFSAAKSANREFNSTTVSTILLIQIQTINYFQSEVKSYIFPYGY